MAKRSETKSPPKRRCARRTKAGKRCKAWALHGSDACMAHSDADTRASVGFTAEAGSLGGRPRVPSPTEVARKLIEDNIAAMLRPYFRTVGYEVEIVDQELQLTECEDGGAKLYGTSQGGVINVSAHDDLGAMIQAVEKLLDRVYGRPTTRSEVTADVTHTTQSEFDREVAELEREMRRRSNGKANGKVPTPA